MTSLGRLIVGKNGDVETGYDGWPEPSRYSDLPPVQQTLELARKKMRLDRRRSFLSGFWIGFIAGMIFAAFLLPMVLSWLWY